MSSFTDRLNITQLSGDGEDWRKFELGQTMVFYVGEIGSGFAVVVPQGFISDGPSVPRILWNVLPVWGKWSRAGILHDYLCCLIAWGHPHPAAPDRNAADRIFLEAMGVLGVSVVWSALLYLGVRVGTWLNIETTMHHSNLKLFEVVSTASEFS